MSDRIERAVSKGVLAGELATIGGSIGGPVGATAGAITGLIIGDRETVFPIDMIAIPAYQAYMIQGSPSMQVYIKQGETLVPTGGEVADVMEVLTPEPAKQRSKRRKKNPWVKFNKSFQYRKQRKNESSKAYFKARQAAASRAYKKEKRSRK